MGKRNFGKLALCSLLGHTVGVALAILLYGVIRGGVVQGGTDSVLGVALEGVFVILIGMPQILLFWALVALPAGAVTVHLGIGHKVVTLALIGAVLGAVALYCLEELTSLKKGLSAESILFGSLMGSFSAAGFSLFVRAWKLLPENKQMPDA